MCELTFHSMPKRKKVVFVYLLNFKDFKGKKKKVNIIFLQTKTKHLLFTKHAKNLSRHSPSLDLEERILPITHHFSLFAAIPRSGRQTG